MRKRTFNTFTTAAVSCLMLVLAGTSAEAYFAYSSYNPGLSLDMPDVRARSGMTGDETFAVLRNSEPTYVFVIDNRDAVSAANSGDDREGRRVRRSPVVARLIAPAS